MYYVVINRTNNEGSINQKKGVGHMNKGNKLAVIISLALSLVVPMIKINAAAQSVGCWAHLVTKRTELAQKYWEEVKLPWVGDNFRIKFGNKMYLCHHFDATPNESTDGSWKIMDNGNGTVTLKIFPGFVPAGALRVDDPSEFVLQEKAGGYRRNRRVKAQQTSDGGVTYTFMPTLLHTDAKMGSGDWDSIANPIN